MAITNIAGGGGAMEINALLQQLLMNMMGTGGAGYPGPGEPLAQQGLNTAFNMLTPGNPLTGLLGSAMGPTLNKAIFGGGPFAGFGGVGTQWNAASRLIDFERERLASTFYQDTSQQSRRSAENQFDLMMQQRGVGPDQARQMRESGDLRFMGIQGAQFAMGVGAVQTGVRNAATAFGYTFGAGGLQPGGDLAAQNVGIRERLTEVNRSLTSMYAEQPGAFGNLTGAEVGDTFKWMARRGQVGLGAGQATAARVQEMSKAIGGLRDVIQGSPAEVMNQVEAAFGTQAIMTPGGGLRAVRALQGMRIMGEATGTSLSDMVQYSQASGMLSHQLTGRAETTPAMGTMISSMMAANIQPKFGIDPAAFARTVTARGVGAALSDPAMMINALLAQAPEGAREGLKARIDQELAGSRAPLTGETLARIGRDAGVNVAADQLLWSSKTASARDYGASDSYGGRAALRSNMGVMMGERRSIVKGALGSDYQEGDEALTSREMEAKYKGRGLDAQMGQIQTRLDLVAGRWGYNNAEEVAQLYGSQRKAERLEKMGLMGAEMAEKYSSFGGGLGGMIRAAGFGGLLNKDMSTLGRAALGMMTEEQAKGVRGMTEGALGREMQTALGKVASRAIGGTIKTKEEWKADHAGGSDEEYEAYVRKEGAGFSAHAQRIGEIMAEVRSSGKTGDALVKEVEKRMGKETGGFEWKMEEELYKRTGSTDVRAASRQDKAAAMEEVLKQGAHGSKIKEIQAYEDKLSKASPEEREKIKASNELLNIMAEHQKEIEAEGSKDIKDKYSKELAAAKDPKKRAEIEGRMAAEMDKFKEGMKSIKGSPVDQVVDLFNELLRYVRDFMGQGAADKTPG